MINMLKNKVLVFLLIIISVPTLLLAQANIDKLIEIQNTNYEIYLKFLLKNKKNSVDLAKIVSIDKFDNSKNELYAYASPKAFKKIVELGIDFEIQIPPSMLHQPKMASSLENAYSWDVYPTYLQYLEMMNNFSLNYPDIFELDTIGYTPEGRLLLVGKISDNVDIDENEPEFFYTSTMHGDEVAGYVLMLRFIDYLLTNYTSSDEIIELINHMEIFINPLANPDGTYRAGNENIYGATRFNSNNVDINRNFPDPDDGQNPDGNPTQPETQIMIDYMASRNFVMAANFHGGEEVVNYPWDTYYKRHADNLWFEYVSRVYADTVHLYSASDYMIDFENGVTNGYDWYTISGGRQDYVNYYANCKEITVEISKVKMPVANELPDFWNYNYRSFIAFMRQVQYGFVGNVLDIETQEPIEAEIYLADYDFDNSQVNCDVNGNFFRPALPDKYNIVAKADGYLHDTIYNVVLSEFESVEINFELKKGVNSIDNLLFSNISIYPNPTNGEFKIESKNQLIQIVELYSVHGILEKRIEIEDLNLIYIDINSLTLGVHFLKIFTKNTVVSEKIVKY